jgi:RES domain-containing protein
MLIFRIADRRHPVWNGTGAMLVGGRFNSPGRPVIYGALTFAGAMLEVLVHARIGKVPKTHVWVEAQVPDGVPAETHTADTLPGGWDRHSPDVARAFGDRWLEEGRTAILIVPSVVARAEFNALVNPAHPDAARIVISTPQQVVWDERLFVLPAEGSPGMVGHH